MVKVEVMADFFWFHPYHIWVQQFELLTNRCTFGLAAVGFLRWGISGVLKKIIPLRKMFLHFSISCNMDSILANSEIED